MCEGSLCLSSVIKCKARFYDSDHVRVLFFLFAKFWVYFQVRPPFRSYKGRKSCSMRTQMIERCPSVPAQSFFQLLMFLINYSSCFVLQLLRKRIDKYSQHAPDVNESCVVTLKNESWEFKGNVCINFLPINQSPVSVAAAQKVILDISF